MPLKLNSIAFALCIAALASCGAESKAPIPPALQDSLQSLGKRLFFSTILDQNGQKSCASCHNPTSGFSAGVSSHAGPNPDIPVRNAPSLWHLSYKKRFNWDGGVPSLPQQVLVPLHPTGDFETLPQAAVERWNKAHPHETPIDLATLCLALEAFQKSIPVPATPWDTYSKQAKKMNKNAKLAWQEFNQKGCASCHTPPSFTDGKFHNTGLPDLTGDEGRYRITGNPEDRYAFGTPSLRGLNATTPYFHDGRSFALDSAVLMHYRGMHGRELSAESLARIMEVLQSLFVDSTQAQSHIP